MRTLLNPFRLRSYTTLAMALLLMNFIWTFVSYNPDLFSQEVIQYAEDGIGLSGFCFFIVCFGFLFALTFKAIFPKKEK